MANMKRKIFCTSCKVKKTDSIEELESKMYPKFCIGHIALIATGIFLVGFELFVK
ncbi:hypothetical protein [Savagea faecisuis]|uniref:Uncharacterized protein n=1 Tax=Savagea faecisuis TaxID=1274803 RepID=A0ABW3GVE3_9BACL